MTTVCQEIASNIGGLFSCTEAANGYVRIRTPYLYPDGDIIDLFYKKVESGKMVLTDLGETLRWLRMQSISRERSKKQNLLINDICQTHGIQPPYRGMLIVQATSQNLVDEMTQLAQVCMRVADLWFTLRGSSQMTMVEEVADFLKEHRVKFEERVKYRGRSGTMRTVDFRTLTPNRNAFVYVLSTGSTTVTKNRVDTVAASWLDLSTFQIGDKPLRFVSLFDDTVDVWNQNNFNMLSEQSDVAYWSRPDEFLEILTS